MRALLNTVGTSLLAHWKAESQELSDESRRRIVAAISGLPAGDRRLGAELSSIRSIAEQEEIAPGDRVYFLVSDTREGRFAGRLLNDVVTAWGYRTAEPEVVKNLQSDDPHAFERGLRNLVQVIARLYRTHGKQQGQPVLLNATGGYKAQISFAGLIGQVFGIPVFYQFEAFPRAIKLPPLPVYFHLDDWLAYRHIFDALESGDGGELLRASDSRYKELPPRLRVLVEQSDGCVTLNALGELYHEGFKERFEAVKALLLPKDSGVAPEKKKIQYEDNNHGKHPGLKEYLEQILQKRYVTRIQTIRYIPEKPTHGRFRADPTSADRVKGSYWDGRIAVEFIVFVSEEDARKVQAAAADLTEEMG
jgi:putative CRISPR-associated protein (TIGR02619 family)